MTTNDTKRSALEDMLRMMNSTSGLHPDDKRMLAEARAELADLRHKLDAANALLWIETHSYPNPMRLENCDGDWSIAVCGYGDKEVTFLRCEQTEDYGIPSLSPEVLAKVKALMFDDTDGDTRYWDERVGGEYSDRKARQGFLAALRASAQGEGQ